MKTAYTLRLATESDLPAINDIYNHYVHHSTCTYQEEPETIENRQQWFRQHDEKHPVIVAETGGQVIGWGSLSTYHARSAYRYTVEDSLYIHYEHHRQGVGSLILQDIIDRARKLGYHVLIGGADGEQTASLALHAKFHFEKIAHLKQVGFKFGRWLDVIYMQLSLSSP